MSSAFKRHEISPDPAAPGPGRRSGPRPVKVVKPAETEAKKTENKRTGKQPEAAEKPEEIGGPSGPEPTRYGDWEIKGRCIDF